MAVPYPTIQQLDPGALLAFYVLDATALGGGITRFHGGKNQLGASVVWQGNTYLPLPVETSGFEGSTSGPIPRPTIRVANVDGMVGGLIRLYQDLVGATVTRKRAFKKFLDAVNFPGGVNPTADPTAGLRDDVYRIERKVAETKDVVEFELSASSDMQGQLLPKRTIQATVCAWTYKGTECGYTGPLSTCDKTQAGANGCQVHFAATTGSITMSAAGNTFTRSSGSFITEGFQVGQLVGSRGFTNAANNVLTKVTAVAALTLTVAASLATEGAAAGRSITSDGQLPFGGFPGAGTRL